MIIAKQVVAEQPQTNEYYQLFTTKEAMTPDNKTLIVLEPIGSYSIADLNRQKESLLTEIDNIDVKLDAINNL